MKTIITIGRQFGSGGRAIGKKVAEELDILEQIHSIPLTVVS